jgi:hypothetical protein
MARQGTIFSDENNVCPLDSPIPLSLYKNLKKKQIPRFRPRTMRDFLRNQLKYNTNDTLDDTAYDRTDLNKEIEEFLLHNVKQASAFAFDEAEIEREFQASFGTAFDEFFKKFEPFIDLSNEDSESEARQYVRTPGATASALSSDSNEVKSDGPQFTPLALPSNYRQVLDSSSDDDSEVYITNRQAGQSPSLFPPIPLHWPQSPTMGAGSPN